MAWIDFTNCEIDKVANYKGSDQKRGIIFENKRYMLKWSDRIPDQKRNSLNSSYSNSVFSEYLGCNIAKMIGFDVQTTILGIIQMNGAGTNTEEHMVIACENFVPEGKELIEFKTIENALLSTKPPKVPHIEHIYEILKGGNAYFSYELGKQALEKYWDIFILDALLGNFDRHANNWGYLIDKETHELTFAPVYDCGSCLYPQISDDAVEEIIFNKDKIQERVDIFPNAALMIDGKKASYKGYISSFENKDCTEALLRIAPEIKMSEIVEHIKSIDEFSELRKKLYITMLTERYNQIINNPYLKALEMGDNISKNNSCLKTSIHRHR